MNNLPKRTDLHIQLGPFSVTLHWPEEHSTIEFRWIDAFYGKFLLSREEWEASDYKYVLNICNELRPASGLAGLTIMTLDRDLRRWVSKQARQLGGFSVHAAGAIVENIGLLMPGISGAGKTTLVTKLEPLCQLVLSDDRCVILPMENGDWKIWGTPFYGTGRQGITGPGVPLLALLFPSKKPHLAIKTLSPLDSIQSFLSAVVTRREDRNGKELSDATNLIERVKGFSVEYSLEMPAKEVMNVIKQAL